MMTKYRTFSVAPLEAFFVSVYLLEELCSSRRLHQQRARPQYRGIQQLRSRQQLVVFFYVSVELLNGDCLLRAA